ncbi:MAG: excinuclease ABC subunit UvrA [Bacteroidetes bacterium]|nr:excinuclease ABC subunit UvrA [Bacteroidota bacterium]
MNKYIEIKGARVHNLKNIDVKIAHGKITVLTGVSGSGKTSLAFDTIYAEGQRRFIESMSSYARQFLGKLDKPDVDYIKGVAPSIAIQQKVISTNPRSTVGTTTEIYDYLKLLFARIGKTYSPISGNEVKKHSIDDVLSRLKKARPGSKLALLSPIDDASTINPIDKIKQFEIQGFNRVYYNNEFKLIAEINDINPKEKIYLVTDRIVVNFEEETNKSRYTDSISVAFSVGKGSCGLLDVETGKIEWFSNRFELDDMKFQEPTPHFFAFNNPFGACKTCEGYGMILGIDEDLVIPDVTKSIYDGAVAPWKGETMGEYLQEVILQAKKFDFPIHRPYCDLTVEQKQMIWEGNNFITGIKPFFKFLESQTYKIQYRVLLSRYRGKTSCPECLGTRLRGDAAFVKIQGKNIQEIVLMPVSKCLDFFTSLHLNSHEQQIVKRILPEIISRLTFLCDVGLGYLTLNRGANTLSGGESQRINLATSLGSSLVGSVYVLDEPSIGLHPKDTERLIKVVKRLKAQGNTVLIVEHEEEIMRAADEILDIGPKAGVHGGQVVFQGNFDRLMLENQNLTSRYLNGQNSIPIPEKRRTTRDILRIEGARQYNLKNISVEIPLRSLVCVTGVSGSGKSTLIRDILYPALRRELGLGGDITGKFARLSGDFKSIEAVEFVDQNPIGKSSRSNPVTYVKAFDEIRELYSRQALSKLRAYKPGFFSFNVEGGRCEMCEGEGTTTVSMQFMADVQLICESCKGKRYKTETLEVTYRGKSIHDLLETTLEDALLFFKEKPDKLEQKIVEKIQPLVDVGLGYLKMGQSSSTMSGGEAQRIKLASFLSKGSQAPHTLFIFDEPTTGLHFFDIDKLLISLNALINKGHSILVIEHNTEIIKCADYIIDIGPEGGEKGGEILFSGTPEELSKLSDNETARFLKIKLSQRI